MASVSCAYILQLPTLKKCKKKESTSKKNLCYDRTLITEGFGHLTPQEF